jgi:hypothetical protein
MRILGSIVAPFATLMSYCDSKIIGSGSIRSQIVRDQLVWDKSILLQKLTHEFQRGTLVPSRRKSFVSDPVLVLNEQMLDRYVLADPTCEEVLHEESLRGRTSGPEAHLLLKDCEQGNGVSIHNSSPSSHLLPSAV